MAVGIVFQIVTPEQLTGTPFFVVAPLMAAPFYGWRATLGFGVAGLAAALAMDALSETMGGTAAAHDLATELTSIGFATAMAVVLNRAAVRSQAQVAAARGVAEAAQRAVLPAAAERIGALRLGTHYEAARQDTLVGGDLYGARDTPYGTRLLIGDVRGKGLEAIETVSIILGAFWETADRADTLTEVADDLERALAREAARRWGYGDAEDFATCVLVEIPDEADRFHTLNLGHPPPLLLTADGTVSELSPQAFSVPLGLSRLTATSLTPDSWAFPPGAMLLLYTDGLSEARDEDGEFYDPVERLAGRAFSSPKRLIGSVIKDVRRHTGGLPADDMALLAVQRPSGRADQTPDH
ncbi:PP2C family protein-serine/threonine phosphatase [Streptomyces sp. NPDC056144]|uniref:PP2C family protein-serine/threonine phosphatase n=1 Tax=unclassified Streptomyces TaxID=2593676 RepID=UPI0035DF8DB7